MIMRSKKMGATHIIRLYPGEKLMGALIAYAKEHQINSAHIRGIGAVTNAKLGFFDLDKKVYLDKLFEENYELISLNGNLAWIDEDPIIHAHIVIAGADYQAIAGHLFEAEITVTAEIFIEERAERFQRVPDETTGLKLINIKE